MKVRISFTVDDLELDVPDGTDMEKYLTENAYELAKQALEDILVLPDSWEEVEE
jgi:hypothetical protein